MLYQDKTVISCFPTTPPAGNAAEAAKSRAPLQYSNLIDI
jgi:hypothetical protein